MPEFHIQAIVSQPFAENTYVAHLEGRQECIVVDPGLEPGKILDYLEDASLTPAAIINTHGHADHIGGNGSLKNRWPDVPLVIAAGDVDMLLDPQLNLSAGFGVPLISPPADGLLREGEPFSAAGFDFDIWEIPGHSPGHVVLVWRGVAPHIVFGGDVLFAAGIGRTDFPGGSFKQLHAGIREKLFTLPDEARVLPGHGPETTIGEERQNNPFVGDHAKERF